MRRVGTRLSGAPLLVIPLEHMDMQFNPNNLQPLDDAGTVYPDIRIVDAWGILTVTGGALMHPRFDRIDVPAPADPARRPIHGDGWTLELEQGWTIGPGARAGDYTLRKME